MAPHPVEGCYGLPEAVYRLMIVALERVGCAEVAVHERVVPTMQATIEFVSGYVRQQVRQCLITGWPHLPTSPARIAWRRQETSPPRLPHDSTLCPSSQNETPYIIYGCAILWEVLSALIGEKQATCMRLKAKARMQ